jgi:hypothetical protein
MCWGCKGGRCSRIYDVCWVGIELEAIQSLSKVEIFLGLAVIEKNADTPLLGIIVGKLMFSYCILRSRLNATLIAFPLGWALIQTCSI